MPPPEPPPLDEHASDALDGSGRFRAELPCYLPRQHVHEVRLARGLRRLLAGSVSPLAKAEDLERAEAKASLELHPLQRSAVLELLQQPVSLLTGGPGVGKTTIVQFVAQLAEAGGAEVLLASPTGRAAKRLSGGRSASCRARARSNCSSALSRAAGWPSFFSRYMRIMSGYVGSSARRRLST